MGWMRECFGIGVREEVKAWTRILLDRNADVRVIRLSSDGMKHEGGETISSEGFRLKHSEIQYIKKRVLNSKEAKWEVETSYTDGTPGNFGKVERLTKVKSR